MTHKIEWQKGWAGNSVLEGDDFYISYTEPSNHVMGIKSWAADDGQAETALCYDGEFYILNGDFRKEYEKVFAKGLGACKKVFEKNKFKASTWSNGVSAHV